MLSRRHSPGFRAVATLALAALAATPLAAREGAVAVTRFSRPETIARLDRAVVAVAPAPGTADGGLEQQVWLGAVAAELAAQHFAAATQGAAGFIAEVRVDRATRTAPPRRGPFSVGIGGMTGGRHLGVGLGTGFNLGGSGPRQIVDTRLAVTIREKATGQALWEGRAETATPAAARGADPATLAPRMAHALIAGFPGRSGETIEVR